MYGNSRLMDNLKLDHEQHRGIGTVVYVAIEDKYAGNIIIADEIKENIKATISSLKKIDRIKRIVMLSGDLKIQAESVGNEIGIDEVYAELLPNDKVSKIEELLENKNKDRNVVFVGDRNKRCTSDCKSRYWNCNGRNRC